jgi:threonylcarbamoyladenosine tRNA methylthiotransferase MtaB
VVFGADIIAGFPTETVAMFENSLRIVREADLSYLHVFAYSARAGTPAARMPQVPRPIRKVRAASLRALGDRQYKALCERRIGATEMVLVEHDGIGRTEQFVPVAVPGRTAGELIPVRVTGLTAGGLTGEALRDAA